MWRYPAVRGEHQVWSFAALLAHPRTSASATSPRSSSASSSDAIGDVDGLVGDDAEHRRNLAAGGRSPTRKLLTPWRRGRSVEALGGRC